MMRRELKFSPPTDFRDRIRSEFDLGKTAPLRIVYVPGPGNLRDTYPYWERGEAYPGKAIVTYSEMFFDVIDALGAETLIIERGFDSAEEMQVGPCTFVRVQDIDYETPGAYWPQKKALTSKVIERCEAFKPQILILGGEFYWPKLPRLAEASGRIVLSFHNMFWQLGERPRDLRSRFNQTVKRVLIGRHVDSVVGVSKAALEQFDELCPHPVPAFQSMHQLPAALSSVAGEPAHRKPQICYLGRIEQEKGVFDLFDAFHAVKPMQTDLKVRFLGAGSALDELREKSSASEYADDLIISGPVDASEVYGALRESQLLIVPTQRTFAEGFPAVCAEAISQETPLLVSTVVPAREVFGDAVMEFEAENSKNLAECLNLLLSDEQKLEEMRKAASSARGMLFDRSNSWGTALANAVLAAAKR